MKRSLPHTMKAILETLSQQEKQVLLLISQGYQNEAIAEVLFISPHTAKNHKENLKRKLKLSSTTQLYVEAHALQVWLLENMGGVNI